MKSSDNIRCIRKYQKKDGSVTYHAKVRRKNAKSLRESFPTLTQAKNWVRKDRIKQKSSLTPKPIFRASPTKDDGTLELALDENLDHKEALDLLTSRIMGATGTANREMGLHLITNVAKALLPKKASYKEMAEHLDIVAKLMQMFAPQDEYEGQLIAQLIILHEQALDWLGRAIRTERIDFANVYLNGGSKLLARHHETLEALLKYRRKGEQRVHVEHVHVHEGGQAIVGSVTTGGGIKPKIEEDPHAKV